MQILKYGDTYENMITCDECNCQFIFENIDIKTRDNKKQFSFHDDRAYAIVSDVEGTITDSEWFGPVALYEADIDDSINTISENVYVRSADDETVEVDTQIVEGDFDSEFDSKVLGKYGVQNIWISQEQGTEPLIQVAGQSFSNYLNCPCCGKEFEKEYCIPWKQPLPTIEPESELE